MLSIVLCGGDPRIFGFQMSAEFYPDVSRMLSKGFKSEFERYFWEEILQKMNTAPAIYVFADDIAERKELELIRQLISQNLGKPIYKTPAVVLRNAFRRRFPKIYKSICQFSK
jgi:hypothetical protein